MGAQLTLASINPDAECKKGRRIVGPSNLVGGTGIEPVTPAV